MADPTIQTFCCHRPNRSDSSVNVLMEFHSHLYNSVCVVSSLLGIGGAMYQVWLFPAESTEFHIMGEAETHSELTF